MGQYRDYDELAKIAARNYMHRQYWGMKWVTVLVVSLMMSFSVNYQILIVPLSLQTCLLWCMIHIGLNTFMRQQAFKLLRAQATGITLTIIQLKRQMNQAAWILYANSVVGIYWSVVLICLYATYGTGVT